MMKMMTVSLLAVLLSACSGMPIFGPTGMAGGAESYAVQMSPAWDEWARENNGGPN
jgi:hypothetical protein